MEALTRLVSESLARYGLDRPVDYRRLQWSRWFRCESLHSLLCVPSKPGVFALAEEIMEFGSPTASLPEAEGRKPETDSHRMLAVVQFGEDDDMAFVLDRMMSRENPMRARIASGRCFVRFVVIEDETQRRSICNALNQWMVSSGEKASGIGAHFASSLELSGVGRTLLSDSPTTNSVHSDDSLQSQLDLKMDPNSAAELTPRLSSGAGINMHCPHPLPSGF